MTIVFKDGTEVLGYWFVDAERTVLRMNLMASVLKQPGETWKAHYRFRYIVDDSLGRDSKDRRSWWLVDSKSERKDDALHLVEGMHKIADMAAVIPGATKYFVELDCSGYEAFDRLAEEPWFNISKEEMDD
jgi:hypothetical protein